MALGRIIGDIFEGIGPLFREVFGGIGDVVLSVAPQTIFQFLVDEWGLGPTMVGVLFLILAILMIVAATAVFSRKKKRRRQRK